MPEVRTDTVIIGIYTRLAWNLTYLEEMTLKCFAYCYSAYNNV